MSLADLFIIPPSAGSDKKAEAVQELQQSSSL